MKVSIFIFLALALSSCGKSEVDKCIEATFEAKMNEAKMHCDSDCINKGGLELVRPIHRSDASKECLRAAAGN